MHTTLFSPLQSFVRFLKIAPGDQYFARTDLIEPETKQSQYVIVLDIYNQVFYFDSPLFTTFESNISMY